MYLSSIAKTYGYHTKIIDAPVERRTTQEILNFCEKIPLQYMVLNLSEKPPQEEYAIVPWCKQHGVKVIGIGYECTVNANEYLERGVFDLILRNESEAIFPELLSGTPFENILGLSFTRVDQVHHNPDHPFLQDLDRLPRPTRSRESIAHYTSPVTGKFFTTIQVGKGCSFRCNFCLAPRFSGTREIHRDIDSIVSEIQYCLDKFDIKEFFLRADNFSANREWVKKLCQRLIHTHLNEEITWYCNSRVDTITPTLLLLMKYAGCRLVTFGMESGSQRILDLMHKGLQVNRSRNVFHAIKKVPITTGIFFILGYPSETWKDLEMSMKFARKTNSIFLQIENYSDYNRTQKIVNPNVLPIKKVRYTLAKRLFTINFYLRPVLVKEIIQKLIFWDITFSNLMYRLGNVLRILWKWLTSRNFM